MDEYHYVVFLFLHLQFSMAASGSDVRDILDLEGPGDREFMTKENLMNSKKQKLKKTDPNFKRPEGMHRELWGLLWTDNK